MSDKVPFPEVLEGAKLIPLREISRIANSPNLSTYVESKMGRFKLRECRVRGMADYISRLVNIVEPIHITPKLVMREDDFLLFEYLDGRDMRKWERAKYLRRLGEKVGRLHSLKVDDDFDPDVHFRRCVDDLMERGQITTEVRDRALESYRRLRPDDLEVGVVHSDMRWFNCMVSGGDVFVVDEESFRIGPKGFDIIRLMRDWLITRRRRRLFLESYSPVSPVDFERHEPFFELYFWADLLVEKTLKPGKDMTRQLRHFGALFGRRDRSRPLRVLFLTKTLSTGDGWGRYSLETVRQVQKLGVHCRTLTVTPADPDEARGLEAKNLLHTFHATRWQGFWRPIDRRRIRRYVEECDLIHCLAEPLAPVASPYGRAKPLVMSAVGTYAVAPLMNGSAEGKRLMEAYRSAAAVVSISHHTQKRVQEYVTPRQTFVVPLGVDVERFLPADPPPRDPKLVIGVGMLKPRKGYDVMIRAIDLVRREVPDVQYRIIGASERPGYEESLHALIKKLDLAGQVRILTDVTDEELLEFYHRARVFALTPLNMPDGSFEGFGLVYLEANACGTPVVGSLDCGAEDAVADGESGFLVPQKDPGAAAKRIAQLLTDDALCETMSEAARRHAREMNWSRVGRSLLDVYENVLSAHLAR